MSNDPFEQALVSHEPLPQPGETDLADALPDDDAQAVIEAATDDLVDADPAASDLSVNDLVSDGVAVEDLEPSAMGRRAMEADVADERRADTIEDRIRQEIPEEGSAIVPPPGGSDSW